MEDFVETIVTENFNETLLDFAVPPPCIGTFCDIIRMDAFVPLFAKSIYVRRQGIEYTFLQRQPMALSGIPIILMVHQ